MEDTPTKLSTCDEEYREQINPENLMVLDTPPPNSICDKVCREQEMNLENLEVLVDDAPTTISIANEGGGDQEFNGEKLIVEDTPPELSFYDVRFYSTSIFWVLS